MVTEKGKGTEKKTFLGESFPFGMQPRAVHL